MADLYQYVKHIILYKLITSDWNVVKIVRICEQRQRHRRNKNSLVHRAHWALIPWVIRETGSPKIWSGADSNIDVPLYVSAPCALSCVCVCVVLWTGERQTQAYILNVISRSSLPCPLTGINIAYGKFHFDFIGLYIMIFYILFRQHKFFELDTLTRICSTVRLRG